MAINIEGRIMDKIIIEELQIYAHHGVYPKENEIGQNFYVNVELETDIRKAGVMDDLNLSTNYGDVCRFLHSFLTEHTYKLIETAAERAAEAVLLTFPHIRCVTMEVRKPEAPIPFPFASVSVKITRGWRRTYIACGSNMGDREIYLNNAVESFRKDHKCNIVRVSEWMETTAYGGVEQADFLNGVIALDTIYTPEELLERIHEIEKSQGRERLAHWGPRTLDLDILLYEGCVMDTPELTIPHKDMANRDFVLKPLMQIAPYERHPVLDKSVLQMYEDVRNKGEEHVI